MKIVAKNFPLRNHKFAGLAAAVSLVAEKHGKFWEVREKLMENYSSLNREKIFSLAAEAGLEGIDLEAAVQDKEISALIRKDMADGRSAGVSGTPSIFVNGRQLRSRSIEGFAQMIDDELLKLKGK